MMDWMNDNPRKRLMRSRDGVIFGVCGGLAERYDLNPWGVRLVVVLLSLPLMPWSLLAYVAMGLMLKKAPGLGAGEALREPDGWTATEIPNGNVLRRIEDRALSLDQRLQRLESAVTRPSFDLKAECDRL